MSNIDKQALREIAAAAVGAHERLSVMPPDDIFQKPTKFASRSYVSAGGGSSSTSDDG